MDKNFKLQRIEPINPEVEHIGHFNLPEFAQNLDKMVSDPADHKIADNLISFMLNKDISAADAKTILASIQNSPNILHSTKDLALNTYNKIDLKIEEKNLKFIKDKNQIFVDQARAVAHDAFIDIVSKYFHGIKIENLKSDKEIAEFLLKNYPDIITEIKLQDPNKISIGGHSLVEAMEKIEKNNPHENYTFMAKKLVSFLSGPEIRDSFENEEGYELDPINKKSAKAKRKEFITKVTDNNKGPMRDVFDSNRFKLSNMRDSIDMNTYDAFDIDLPEDLTVQIKELNRDLTAGAGVESLNAYEFMDYSQKEILLNKSDELARKILEDILQKHLH